MPEPEIHEMVAFARDHLPASVARSLLGYGFAVQGFVCGRLMSAMATLEEKRITLDPIAFEAVMGIIADQALRSALQVQHLTGEQRLA